MQKRLNNEALAEQPAVLVGKVVYYHLFRRVDVACYSCKPKQKFEAKSKLKILNARFLLHRQSYFSMNAHMNNLYTVTAADSI